MDGAFCVGSTGQNQPCIRHSASGSKSPRRRVCVLSLQLGHNGYMRMSYLAIIAKMNRHANENVRYSITNLMNSIPTSFWYYIPKIPKSQVSVEVFFDLKKTDNLREWPLSLKKP